MCTGVCGGTSRDMTETPQDPVDPQPDDAPTSQRPVTAGSPEPKETGTAGWESIAPPGKPDGEVDTR